MSWDSETATKIREAKVHVSEARRLLTEAQLTSNWDDLKPYYQDKVTKAIQDLRNMNNDL